MMILPLLIFFMLFLVFSPSSSGLSHMKSVHSYSENFNFNQDISKAKYKVGDFVRIEVLIITHHGYFRIGQTLRVWGVPTFDSSRNGITYMLEDNFGSKFVFYECELRDSISVEFWSNTIKSNNWRSTHILSDKNTFGSNL